MKNYKRLEKGTYMSHPSTTCLQQVMKNADIMSKFLLKEMNEHKHSLNLICKGSSGVILATMIADRILKSKKYKNIKTDTISFVKISYFKNDKDATTGNEYYYPLSQSIKKNWIEAIVDDFVCTGKTIEHILFDYVLDGLDKDKFLIGIDHYEIDYLLVNSGCDYLAQKDRFTKGKVRVREFIDIA